MTGHSSSYPELADLRRDVIKFREWQDAVLGCCKACDGFDALQWGGDKSGWGFVMFFISHLNTRALHAETVLAEQNSRRVAQRQPDMEALERLIQRHASAYVARGSAISDSIIAECRASREALLTALAEQPSPAADSGSLKRRSEADAYFKILQTIARFPITDPKNMDAMNLRLIAEGALALSSTHQNSAKG